MKVAEGIERVDGIVGVNAYLVEVGDGTLALVDTGLPGSAPRILDAVRELGHEPSDLATIIITHGDPDHSGSAHDLKDATGAKVAVHAFDAPAIAGRRATRDRAAYAEAGLHPATNPARAMHNASMRVVFALSRWLDWNKPVEPDVLLGEGDLIAGMRVHHVPGHTAGSIALARRDGALFSGDAVLGDGAGHPMPPRKALALDYERALESARQIAASGYAVLLPGHGEPVEGKPRGEREH